MINEKTISWVINNDGILDTLKEISIHGKNMY